VIDTATNSVVTTIDPAGPGNTGIAASPTDPLVYTADEGGGTVTVINTNTNTVVDPPIDVGSVPVAVAFLPNGSRAYVANKGGDNVSVINTATSNVIDTVPVGDTPRGVAVISQDP
jgi:YVTN family beta-propeller protein